VENCRYRLEEERVRGTQMQDTIGKLKEMNEYLERKGN
jgi:hypothetical protein